MKNKKNIYILLPLVLFIWGVVIYKFFSFTGTDEIAYNDAPVGIKPIQLKKPEPIIIKADYRDPFLGKMYLPEIPKKKSSAISKNKIAPQPVVWPQVIYKGLVTDQKNRKKVFMIVVNGQTHLTRENETIGNITLKKGNRNSIDIKYKGDITTILLEE